MRRSLLPILCCPVCKGDLVLTVDEEDKKEILKGDLHCPVCKVHYPIEEGIPNLLPQSMVR